MGHTHCGAIQATFDAVEGKNPAITENIHDIVKRIEPHIHRYILGRDRPKDKAKARRAAMRANVRASANYLRHSSRFLEEMVRLNELLIVAAENDIDTGEIEFVDLHPPRRRSRKP